MSLYPQESHEHALSPLMRRTLEEKALSGDELSEEFQGAIRYESHPHKAQ